MKKIIVFAVMLFTVNTWAQCQKGQWVAEPKMEGRVLITKIKTLCNLSGEKDLFKFKDYMLNKVTEGPEVTQVNAINEGVVFEDLHGVMIDSTSLSESEDGDLTIQWITHLVTDGKDLVSFQESKKIHGTRNAKYTKKVSERLDIKTVENGYLVELVSIAKIKKPGLAPVGIFVDMASEAIEESFDYRVEELEKELKDNL